MLTLKTYNYPFIIIFHGFVYTILIFHSKHSCFILFSCELLMNDCGFRDIQHVYFLYCGCIYSQHCWCLAASRRLSQPLIFMENLHFSTKPVPDYMTLVIVADFPHNVLLSAHTSSWTSLCHDMKGAEHVTDKHHCIPFGWTLKENKEGKCSNLFHALLETLSSFQITGGHTELVQTQDQSQGTFLSLTLRAVKGCLKQEEEKMLSDNRLMLAALSRILLCYLHRKHWLVLILKASCSLKTYS